MLLLKAVPENYSGPEVYASPATPMRKNIEYAGRAYHSLCVSRTSATFTKLTEKSKKQKSPQKTYVKNVDHSDLTDFYALLGLDKKKLTATEAEIRAAYREVSLIYHPDKKFIKDVKKCEDTFKAIQLAYETLSEEKKRRTYDSSLPFDESIPKYTTEEEFFGLFSEAFRRYSVFSTTAPVPTLGDMSSSYEEVNGFYDFWFEFKSWREFPHVEDMHKLEEAETREEKRWMERQNLKLQSSLRKRDTMNIRKLAERAFKHDPRIKLFKQQQKEEKLKKKREKEEAWKRKEEAARLEREEKEKALLKEKENEKEKDKLAKKKAANEKKQLKKLKKQIIAICEGIDENVVFERLNGLSKAEISAFLMKLKSFDGKIELIRRAVESKDSEENEKENREESPEKTAPEWTMEEIHLLTKAVKRFPGGTVDRWEKISDFLGTSRTTSDVMGKAKDIKKNGIQRLTNSATGESEGIEEWTNEQQKSFEHALKSVPKSAIDRWAKISEHVEGKTKKECIERFKQIRALLSQKKQ